MEKPRGKGRKGEVRVKKGEVRVQKERGGERTGERIGEGKREGRGERREEGEGWAHETERHASMQFTQQADGAKSPMTRL